MPTKRQLPCKLVGSGPNKLIAVHGWMADHRLFDRMHAYIDKNLFTVAFLDCSGYGMRKGEGGPFTVEAIASDILELANEFAWPEFLVLGHSMAGMAVQRLMIDVPVRIRHAFLLSPVPACGAKIDQERRNLLLNALSDRAARQNLINVNTGKKRLLSWLDELSDLSISSAPATVLEEYMTSWTGTDFSSAIVGNSVPTTIVVGELDPGATKERMQETLGQWLSNFAILTLQNCGHYGSWESPEVLMQILNSAVQAPATGIGL